MGLFRFFSKQESFPLYEKINRSIDYFIRYFEEDEKIFKNIARVSESDDEANKIYLFIPMVFCRLFVTEVQYSDIYITSGNISHKFSECIIFKEIMKVAKERILLIEGNDLMKILYHSGDFKAINEALKDGTQLENLESVPSVIM